MALSRAGLGVGAAIVRGGRVEAIGRKQGLPKRSVWAVAQDRDGALLLGTTIGLYRAHRGALRRFSVASGHLDDDWVTAIAVRDDALFVGTYSHGVTRLERAEAALEPHHLGGGFVNFGGLLVRDDRVYAATMSGLKSVPVSGGEPWRLHRDVAPSRDVTAVVAGEDGVWIGSRRGLARL